MLDTNHINILFIKGHNNKRQFWFTLRIHVGFVPVCDNVYTDNLNLCV